MDRRTFLKQAALVAAATACAKAPASPPIASTTTISHVSHAPPVTTSAPPSISVRGEILQVEGSLTLEESLRVPGVIVQPGATLTFAPNRDITLESTGNIVVLGELAAAPDPEVVHTIRFVDLDEKGLVGGGMDVLDTDVGLWVMEGGRLDLNGAPKTSWSYEVESDWLPDDEVVIAPIAAGDYNGFITTTAKAVSGQLPGAVGEGWKAELLNLTRNVRIESGTEGRAHVFIRSTSPQSIRYTSLDRLGPSGVIGRYPLHFHHSGTGSRGSVVEGVVARQSGKHAFVPHVSEGITFSDCIAFDTTEEAFWWDEQEASNGIVWHRCVAALVHLGDQPHRLSGFFLGDGFDNVVTESVAVGVLGGKDTGGFSWPSFVREGDWDFRGNRSHNNQANGLWVWQNQRTSTVEDFLLFHNGNYGISHGAYNNDFLYRDGTIFGSGAASLKFTANGATFQNVTMDGAGFTPVGVLTGRHPVEPRSSTLFVGCAIEGHSGPKVLVALAKEPKAAHYDFVECGVGESDVVVEPGQDEGMRLRALDGDHAFAIEADGEAAPIDPFEPELVTVSY